MTGNKAEGSFRRAEERQERARGAPLYRACWSTAFGIFFITI